jgi:hypothetical protein
MAIAYIQKTPAGATPNETAAGASITSDAFGANLGIGNLVVAICAQYRAAGAPSQPTFSDSDGNTWYVDRSLANANNQRITIAHCYASTTNKITITAQATSTDSIGVGAVEFSGVPAGLTAGGSANSSNSGTSNAPTTGNLVVVGNAIYIGLLNGTIGAVTITVGAGFTKVHEEKTGSYPWCSWERLISTGTINPSWSLSGSVYWSAVGVAFAEGTVEGSGNIDAVGSMTQTQKLLLGQSGNIDAAGSVIQSQKLLLNQSGNVDAMGSMAQAQKLLLKQSGDIDASSNLTEAQKLLYKTSGNIDAMVDMTESNKLLYKLAGIIEASADMTQNGTLLLKISGEIDALADILFQYQDIISITATMDASADAAVSYRLLQKQLANIDAVGSVNLSSIVIMLNAVIDIIGSMLAQQEITGEVHYRLTAVMKNISELTAELKNTSQLTGKIENTSRLTTIINNLN